MIPRILHQVRIGVKKTPTPDEEIFLRSFHSFNPGWEVMVWDEERVRSCLDMHYTLLRIRPFVIAADIIRLMALEQYGGMYLDLDVACGGCVDDFLKPDMINVVNIWADINGKVSNPFYYTWSNNWMLAAPGGHPLMVEIAKSALSNAMAVPEETRPHKVCDIAGPVFIGSCARKYPDDIFLVGHTYLYEQFCLQQVKPPTNPILVHLAESSWQSKNPPRRIEIL